MTSNELVLIDQVLASRQSDRETPIRDDDAFELFACEQAMRDYDLSEEEIAQGIVGGGNDGGIDGMYTYLGDTLIVEDSEVLEDDFPPTRVGRETVLSLHLVQAKRETSFTETAVDLAASSLGRLLDLGLTEEALSSLYSTEVVTQVGIFRKALLKFAMRHPSVRIRFSYVSRGSTAGINSKVLEKAGDLENQLAGVVTGAVATVDFMGAAELWESVSTLPTYTLQLSYQENATSGGSHVGLVTLRDYLDFLTDTSGALRRYIFDWNVRDYQGEVEVNKEIARSLASNTAPEFWWLNNGVTIVCSRTTITGKTYSLDDVQVVNGLQTSQTIFNVLTSMNPDDPAFDRSVLVRILVAGDDPGVRDQIIRATNSQTSVPAASLRATDQIQRQIENHFLTHGWYYDRRKNFHRNMGRPADRIVGIPLLAQAVMAMGLSQPDDSRARPSSLLKRQDDYEKIFTESIPLATYLWFAQAQRTVDAFLLTNSTSAERTNLRFHLAMLAAARTYGSRVFNPAQLNGLASGTHALTDDLLTACLVELKTDFADFAARTGDSVDKIAKGQTFVSFVLDRAFPAAPTVETPEQ